MDSTIPKLSPSFECKYCNKKFMQEKTLIKHLCEPKRRWQQEKEKGVQLGLLSYVQFYQLTSPNTKTKTYADFVESSYYNAFVKFGRYMVNIGAVRPDDFTKHLLFKNIPLDRWCSDKLYDVYLVGFIRTEHYADAVSRSIETMQKWADNNEGQFNHYFLYENPNRILKDITNGKISPWVLYHCDQGIRCLGGMTSDQIKIIFDFIDPDFWRKKFHVNGSDVSFVKDILDKAGLNV